MKRSKIFVITAALAAVLTSCNTTQSESNQNPTPSKNEEITANTVEIELSDNEIKVNGAPAETDPECDVYVGNNIIYYESGKDFTYGEGSDGDAHSAEAAAEHTVVSITQPGTYSISGSLSKGQIAIDLGDGAEEDPDAVVTLILNGTDVTCEVAPAIIFYRV